MENAKIKNMYDLSQSIAGEYLSQFTYPWEALKGISDFIKKLGRNLIRKFMRNVGKISGWQRVQPLRLLHA